MTIAVALSDPDHPRVEAIWRALEARSDAPYFLSWGWIENWLACLPPEHAPQLATFLDGGLPVAACFVGTRRRTVFLNATGVPTYDELCGERNGVLRARGTTLGPGAAAELVPVDRDELVASAIEPHELASLAVPGWDLQVERDTTVEHVDLAGVLASSGRQLRVERASDLEHARDIYAELVALHQAQGDSGTFGQRWFYTFHRWLIERRFASGEIELVRVTARGRTVGCLYDFVYRGRVQRYASAFASREQARRVTASGPRSLRARVQRPSMRHAFGERMRRWRHALV